MAATWLKGLPRISLDLGTSDPKVRGQRRRRVLLATQVSVAMTKVLYEGATVIEVPNLQRAFDELDSRSFDAIVFRLTEELLEYGFARAVLRDEPVVDPRLHWLSMVYPRLESIQARHRNAVAVLVPEDEFTSPYLVVTTHPPDFEEDPGNNHPATVILHLDPSKLDEQAQEDQE